MTPHQLFDWASINIPAVHFDYCSSADYEVEQKNLEQRFMKAGTIPGTRKIHSFIPISKDKLLVKKHFQHQAPAGKKESLLLEMIYLQNQFQDLLLAWLTENGGWLACYT